MSSHSTYKETLPHVYLWHGVSKLTLKHMPYYTGHRCTRPAQDAVVYAVKGQPWSQASYHTRHTQTCSKHASHMVQHPRLCSCCVITGLAFICFTPMNCIHMIKTIMVHLKVFRTVPTWIGTCFWMLMFDVETDLDPWLLQSHNQGSSCLVFF